MEKKKEQFSAKFEQRCCKLLVLIANYKMTSIVLSTFANESIQDSFTHFLYFVYIFFGSYYLNVNFQYRQFHNNDHKLISRHYLREKHQDLTESFSSENQLRIDLRHEFNKYRRYSRNAKRQEEREISRLKKVVYHIINVRLCGCIYLLIMEY